MSDYISKSALIKTIDEQVQGWGKQGIVPSLFSAIAIVQNQPTIDEKEIIRKQMERIVERLEENTFEVNTKEYGNVEVVALDNAIKIVKEEGGIE